MQTNWRCIQAFSSILREGKSIIEQVKAIEVLLVIGDLISDEDLSIQLLLKQV